MAEPEQERERLRQLLREHSLQFGDFTLASGRKSHYYFDSKRTTLLSEGAYLAAREVLREIARHQIEAEAIGGMTLGADPVVCAIAALSWAQGRPLHAFLVRKEAKEHGTGRRIEGNLPPGTRVVVFDDVVTTGGSTLRAIEAAQEAGLEVVAVVCLVDREEGGGDAIAARFPFYPIFRRSDLL